MPAVNQSPIPNPQSLVPPAKDPSRISGMFDAIAGRYDFLNHLLSAGLDRQWRKRAVDALELTGRETVLDVCTGTADLALAATTGSARARRAVGIDFSGAMLHIGQEKIGAAPVTLVRADATRIPLADASVDAATIGFGIRNVEQPALACREIARVLRPGGKLAILEFSLPQTPALRTSLPLVLPENSAAHRKARVETSERIQLSAGIRAGVSRARDVRPAAPRGRIWHRACSPTDLWRRLLVRRRKGRCARTG